MFPRPLYPGQLCPHLGPQAPKAHEPPREEVPALALLPAQHLQPDPDTPQQPGSSPQGARRSPAPPADKDGEWTPGRGAPCPAPEVCECGCVCVFVCGCVCVVLCDCALYVSLCPSVYVDVCVRYMNMCIVWCVPVNVVCACLCVCICV